MLEFKLTPFDVLYFGKTKPFSIGDVVKSDYIPSSYMLASAVCSKLYQAFNIQTQNIIKTFYGPFVEYDKKLYIFKPHNIYKFKSKYSNNYNDNNLKYFILIPINLEKNFEIFKIYDCDNNLYSFSSYFLYFVHNNEEDIEQLPANKMDCQKSKVDNNQEDIEPFEGLISLQALEKYIQRINKIDFKNLNNFQNLDNILKLEKNDILDFEDIFDFDQRIGIRLDDNTRNVYQQNGLYRVDFLSLKPTTLNHNFSFVFYLEFNESLSIDFINFFKNNRILKLGGENKFTYYNLKEQSLFNKLNYYSKIFKNSNNKENYQKILNKDRIFVIFLTDGYYRDYQELQESINYKFKDFKIESIIFNGLKIVGKYSVKAGNTKVSKKVLPPGTVLFLTKNNQSNNQNTESNQLNVMLDFLINKNNLLNSDFIGSNLVLFF